MPAHNFTGFEAFNLAISTVYHCFFWYRSITTLFMLLKIDLGP